MSTVVVARKEFKDGIRSRALLALIALFVIFAVVEVYTTISNPQVIMSNPSAHRTAVAAIDAIDNLLFVMLVGLLVGYNAISGERESGSLKLLLGLPHTRRAVMAGKFLGRAALLVVAMLVGFVVGGVLTVLLTGGFPVGEFFLSLTMAVFLGLIYVSIAVGVSSAIRTQARATRAAIGIAFVFYSWDTFAFVLGFFLDRRSLPYELLSTIGPKQAYRTAIIVLRTHLVHPENSTTFLLTAGFGSHPPFYLQHWFAFVVLLFWLVVPSAIAYVRFQRMDLR